MYLHFQGLSGILDVLLACSFRLNDAEEKKRKKEKKKKNGQELGIARK